MFSQVEDLLPVISFDGKKSSDLEKKHKDFTSRMRENGYTDRQIRRLCEWYQRVRKAS
jgi:serine protein kinase